MKRVECGMLERAERGTENLEIYVFVCACVCVCIRQLNCCLFGSFSILHARYSPLLLGLFIQIETFVYYLRALHVLH